MVWKEVNIHHRARPRSRVVSCFSLTRSAVWRTCRTICFSLLARRKAKSRSHFSSVCSGALSHSLKHHSSDLCKTGWIWPYDHVIRAVSVAHIVLVHRAASHPLPISLESGDPAPAPVPPRTLVSGHLPSSACLCSILLLWSLLACKEYILAV